MIRYLLPVLTLLLMGCGDTQPADSAVAQGSPASALPANSSADQPAAQTAPDEVHREVSLQIKSWDEVQQMVAGAQGKIVVLDLWSTACPPCLKELPHLVEMQKKYASQGVHCISVSCDYDGLDPLDTYREMVLDPLRQIDATITNVMLNVPSDELYPKLELASIPAVYVYGRDGQLVKRFDNDAGEYEGEGFTYAREIVPMVERLLSEKN